MPDVLRFLSLLAIAVLCCGGYPSCCDFHLVTGPHGVSDDAITASTWILPPPLAIINSSSSWFPADTNNGHYLQVKFRHDSLLKSIMTRGWYMYVGQYVSLYKVSTSMDGLTWADILTSTGDVKMFPGNIDGNTVVTNELEGTVVARYIRVTSVDGHGYRSMRLEVQGCPVSQQHGTCSRWKGKLGSTGDVLPVLVDTDARNPGLCGVKCSRQPECHSFLFDVTSARCRLLKATPEGSHDTVSLDGVWYFVKA